MSETERERQSRLRNNLQAEIDGAALYRALADLYDDPNLARVYRDLADTEERHAVVWRNELLDAGATDLPDNVGWRTRALISLARQFGPGLILPTMLAQEQADANKYQGQPEAAAAGLVADEQSHARIFRAIEESQPTGLIGNSIAQLEGRHRASGGNALRAAVLGANDGLVSNASLVMGVAGAQLSGQSILVTGMAGLLAGSLSMAMGEWLSVQSARELYQHQIAIENAELLAAPAEEATELALIYEAKGVPREQARALADHLVQDHDAALDTLSREELGIDPAELGGSAWTAAITSFCLFAVGAIIPVAPYFVMHGSAAVLVSVVLSVIALFAIGAAITIITGANAGRSGLRQVLIGLAAAAITYGAGHLANAILGV